MSQDQNPILVQAPTYNELFNLAAELRSRLEVLERNTTPGPDTLSVDTEPRSIADYRFLPDLDRAVTVFTGRETNCVADDWIRSVDALASINNWPLPYRLQYAKSNMSNAARSWYLTETFRDWADFLAKFRAAFVRTLRMSDRWKQLNERLQGESEHIAEYFYEKVRLCQALQLSFAETRDHVVMGIRSQELASFAMSRVHSTTADLLSDFREWERLYELRRVQFPSVPKPESAGKTNRYEPKWPGNDRREVKSMSTPGVDVAQGPVQNSFRSQPTSRSSSVRCFNCNANGHYAKDCPKPCKPCAVCKSTSHSRGQCSVTKTTATLCAEILTRGPENNCFVKDLLFNDIKTTCLIDSGSSDVLVRVSLVKRSATAVIWNPRSLYIVGDAFRPTTITLGDTTANIMIEGAYAADHPVIVVSDHSIPVDVIVGRSWLNLPHINYYKRGGEFVIESLLVISPSTSSERDIVDVSDVHTAFVSAGKPVLAPLTLTDIQLDPQVPKRERNLLLLLINEYRDVFAQSLAELGCTDIIEMHIPEIIGSGPVRLKPYRNSPSDRQIIAKILDEWRSAGIISDSTSPYRRYS